MAASVLNYICIKDGQSKIYKRVYDPVFKFFLHIWPNGYHQFN